MDSINTSLVVLRSHLSIIGIKNTHKDLVTNPEGMTSLKQYWMAAVKSV